MPRKKSAAADGQLPPSPAPLHTPLVIDGDSAVVIGDLHCPYHNTTMLIRAIQKSRLHGIDRLIIAGDLMDFDSLSRHPHNQPESEPSMTVRSAGDVLRYLFASFSEVVIISGNHDERLAKRLDANWDMELLINAALGRNWPECTVYITNFDYVYLGEKWLIGHPSNYSGQGGQTPSILADLYHRNVVTLHNHVVGMSQSKSGKYLGIDCGHMTDPRHHYYAARRLSKATKWRSGFVVIERGYPFLYTEDWSDWT